MSVQVREKLTGDAKSIQAMLIGLMNKLPG
jgi:hypothetical protein